MSLELQRPAERQVAAQSERFNVWSVITSLTMGGAESLVVGLNKCFSLAGHNHTVVALCDAQTLGNSTEFERSLAETIAKDGGRFVSLKLGRRRDPISARRALNRLLEKESPDVIHAHTARIIAGIAASRFTNKVVLTHHNSRLSFPSAFFRFIDLVVDTYVAISPETEAKNESLCSKPARRISNGISAAFIADTARKPVDIGGQIISVGAISDQKNYDLLLAAAHELGKRHPDKEGVKFNIAGPGAKLPEYRRKVREAGLEGAVEFLGARSDVPELLRAANIYLNTSNYEGQSVAMLEAMATALPVIATDVPGNRDLVKNRVNGILVDNENPGAIADAVEQLLTDQDLYAECSKGALEIGRRFSVAETAAQHLDLYKSLTRKRQPTSQKG